MVRRQNFINKIHELKYKYKTKQKRTDLWRKIGGTHYISVPLRDLLEEEFVICSLKQAGVPQDEIKSFIACAKA